MNSRYTKVAFAALPLIALLTLYQNCGQGMSSSNGSSSALNTNPLPGPNPGPGPSPNPNPNPNPTSLQNVWSAISMTGAPIPRSAHTAVWSGTRMLVWGGSAGNGNMTNTGGIYDPVGNSWSAMSTTGAPVARAYHRAVWTGTHMVVWGGATTATQNSVVTTNTGGIYDPTTNTWVATNLTGAPQGRWYFNMAAVAGKVVVWGGNINSNTSATDHAVLDPVTNTWTQIAALNQPFPTPYSRSAVVGDKIVFFGGDQGQTGGIYDVATNSWQALNLNGAPAARFLPYAVSTGTKAIFFGGFLDNGAVFNSGGVYDLATNSWQLITQTGAPIRYELINGNNAVWTGSEMIVWGSDQAAPGNLPLRPNSGGIYNPNTNSWVATSATGAPAGRLGHSAVWTGNQMIIYGGIKADGFLFLNTEVGAAARLQ